MAEVVRKQVNIRISHSNCLCRSLTNAEGTFKLILILHIFHTFSVNSHFKYFFPANKCSVLIQTCSRTTVDLEKKTIWNKNDELFENTLHLFGWT